MISCLVRPFSLQRLQVLHQVADGEVRGIALAVVAVFLAQLEGRDVGYRHDLAAIAAAFEDRLDDAFVLPGEAAEEDGHLAALFGAEGALRGTLEVMDGTAVQPHHARQSGALLRQLALNLFLAVGTRQFVNREIDASDWHVSSSSSSELCSIFCQISLVALDMCGAGRRRVWELQRRPIRVKTLTA